MSWSAACLGMVVAVCVVALVYVFLRAVNDE